MSLISFLGLLLIQECVTQGPHSGGPLGYQLHVFKPELYTSDFYCGDKNRQVSLMKQETIGIIFNCIREFCL